jgi:quercetin dioxygenase-like cupin family protein/DNA-binding XRE family transcriptional regulator
MGELGRRSGVSQPFISQVESGQFAPSLVTLYKIAGALNIPASRLLPGDTTEGSKLTRAGHGVPVPMSDLPDSPISTLVSRAGDAIEALHFRIDGDFEPYWFEHPGDDFVYVISGRIEVEVKPDPPVVLGPGDSFHHAGETEHAWRMPADASEPVELLLVVTHPEHTRFTDT